MEKYLGAAESEFVVLSDNFKGKHECDVYDNVVFCYFYELISALERVT